MRVVKGTLGPIVLCAVVIAGACGDSDFEWEHWIREPGPGSDLGPPVIAVDKDGSSVAVTLVVDNPSEGYIYNSSHVRKFDSRGNELWHARIELFGEHAAAVDIAIHGKEVFVLGDTWLARLSRDGKRIGKVVRFQDRLFNMAIDHDGNIVVVGTVLSENPFTPIAVTKLAPDGTNLWRVIDDEVGNYEKPTISTGPNGDVIVATNLGTGGLLLQKYDSDGLQLWAHRPAFDTDVIVRVADVAVFEDETFLVAGALDIVKETIYDPGPTMAWANLYDQEGGSIWPRPFMLTLGGAQNPWDNEALPLDPESWAAVTSIALDPNNQPVLVGYWEDDLWFKRIERRSGLTVACRAGSICDWPTTYQHAHAGIQRGAGIDQEGHLFLAGEPGGHHGGVSGIWLGKLGYPSFPKDTH